MKQSAKQNMLFWLQNNTGWHHGGELQRKEIHNRNGSNATGDTLKRRLNELVKEGKAFVEYRKGEAWFSAEYKPKMKQTVHFIEEPDGSRKAIITFLPLIV